MAVHFKFRSAVDFDSINIDGNGITIANLKDKIVEQKNLGRGTDFDLLITNAESGEEYTDESFLVPKNTSVIIKRVPARRAKATLLLVHDEFEDDALEQQPPHADNKDGDVAQLALTSTMDELYDMDDFGVDLYAVDESALTHVEAEEISNASALIAKNATDGKRLSQEMFSSSRGYGRDAGRNIAKGHGFGRASPPSGYVCHRCGQPGHFIQHCPTNGDPAYDLKRGTRLKADHEDSSILAAAIMQSNNVFAKEADPLPPELLCSLCQGIFKEAVMIPCCQYSFCDTCIRQALLEKGICPQCGSEKSKNGDLLPNVALRQAIDRFTNAQIDPTLPNEGADVESATKAAKVSSPTPTQLHKPSFTMRDALTTVVIENQPDLLVVDDSVCESAIGSKEKSVVEGSKSVAHTGDAPFAGKKKKKPYVRPVSVSDDVAEHIVTGKPRKANRFCYLCGSPDHLARHCTGNGGDNIATYPSQRGMFHPVGPVPPRGMTPYGQEMYWPGQPIVHVRPLPLGYGEGMYGPCSAVPYGAPALPIGPYGVSSYTPPMYPNPPMHGFLGGVAPRMMAPRERPLSREEFMELQERERRRRITQERQEREPSEEKPQSIGGGGGQSLSPGSDHSLHKQRPLGDKFQGTSWRRDFDQSYSKETVSSKSKLKHSRKLLMERPDEHMVQHHFDDESDDDSAFDDSRGHRLYSLKRLQNTKPLSSVTRKSSKFHDWSTSERVNSDSREDNQNARMRALKEDGLFKSSKQSSLGRCEAVTFEKHEYGSYVKHDGTRVSNLEAGVAEGFHMSRHRPKRMAFEVAKMVYSDLHVKGASEMKDRHHQIHHHDFLSDDGGSIEMEKKHSERKHHSQAKIEMMDHTSGDEVKKKRRHKRHKSEGLKDVSAGSGLLEDVSMEAPSHKKHKSDHTSPHISDKHKLRSLQLAELPPVEDNIEESRWQMDDGLDKNASLWRERSKHKHQHHRSSKSAL